MTPADANTTISINKFCKNKTCYSQRKLSCKRSPRCKRKGGDRRKVRAWKLLEQQSSGLWWLTFLACPPDNFIRPSRASMAILVILLVDVD